MKKSMGKRSLREEAMAEKLTDDRGTTLGYGVTPFDLEENGSQQQATPQALEGYVEVA